MGNYFNELRWKIIRANNLLQLIHQVAIEIRFRKSLAQERFKSNLEFRNLVLSNLKDSIYGIKDLTLCKLDIFLFLLLSDDIFVSK